MSREIFTETPIGPWRATIRIIAWTPELARRTSLPYHTLFTVAAEWTGPPGRGFPPSDTPVAAGASIVVTSYTAALKVARQAGEQLRTPQVPDLRALAGLDSTSASLSPARALIP